ncbi:hypothetical protein [uncultured Selenomonas sp.]|uniref:hypothetical protein n=1 Tax=uncultured Selenomonas sp. TaxID=159275 RepID=UPI0025CD33B5|nr:hypothetical protein [uncultured Selenomonas sp.]
MLERWKDYLSARYRRQQAAVGAGLLLLLSLGAMLHEDPLPTPVPPTVSRSDVSVTEVQGLSAAAEGRALHNPFTMVHAAEGETEAMPLSANPHEEKLPSQLTPAALPLPQKAQPKAETPLVLRGIVTGADGRRIAILARGKDSAALAAGDTWHGYTLDALTERTATLRTAHGVITLTRE